MLICYDCKKEVLEDKIITKGIKEYCPHCKSENSLFYDFRDYVFAGGPLNLKKKFFELFDKEVKPFLDEDKYIITKGHDMLVKNFTYEDEVLFNNFYRKNSKFFKKGIWSRSWIEYSKYKEGLLIKHVFDY